MLGAFTLYCLSMNLGKLWSNNEFSASHMRLTTRHFRGGGRTNSSALGALPGVSSAGVQSLGVLYDGCPLHIPHKEFYLDSSHYVSFERQVKGNGFSLRTLAQRDTQHLDALGFTVAVCAVGNHGGLGSPLDCAEEDWEVVGSSRCAWTIYGVKCTNVKNGLYDTSLVRDVTHMIPLTASWFHIFCLLTRSLYVVVGCWGALPMALMGYYRGAVRWNIFFCCFLNGIINGFGLALQRFYYTGAFSAVLPFGGGLFLGMTLWGFVTFGERYVVNLHILPCVCLCIMICVLFDGLVVFPGDEYFIWKHLYEGWWAEPSLLVQLWLIIALCRFNIRKGARRDIQQVCVCVCV